MEVIVEEDVNATAVEGLVANITKEPQFIIKKSLQFKSGMNVLGGWLELQYSQVCYGLYSMLTHSHKEC